MLILEKVADVHAAMAEYKRTVSDRRAGRKIGLVPTMGALHEGHRSLIRRARAECDVVVVSIFVNPTQFGANEDLSAYPRPLSVDLAICEADGADVVFCPPVEEMYPPNGATTVSVARLTAGLCGTHRPGHFEGVTTVVAKLFNIVGPDVAYFGQKDAQQVVVLRKMARDLLWPLQIVTCPTVREPDGLALSSRNVYLSPAERQQALCLSTALKWARQQIEGEGQSKEQGQRDVPTIVQGMTDIICQAGPCEIDYIEIVDADELTPKQQIEGRCLIALAVRIGKTRLIDNDVIEV